MINQIEQLLLTFNLITTTPPTSPQFLSFIKMYEFHSKSIHAFEEEIPTLIAQKIHQMDKMIEYFKTDDRNHLEDIGFKFNLIKKNYESQEVKPPKISFYNDEQNLISSEEEEKEISKKNDSKNFDLIESSSDSDDEIIKIGLLHFSHCPETGKPP